MVSFLLADAKDLVDPRYLGSNIPLRSPGMIAWYCFLAVVVVPIISCGIHILYRNQIRHARAQSAIEDEQRIESIEANVQVWSAAEEQRHYRVIKCAVGQNIEVGSTIQLADDASLCSFQYRDKHLTLYWFVES